MKKVLVIYFTQSGQLNRAVQATLAPLEKDQEMIVHYEQIRPKSPYPFPWTYMQFFNVFPESVHGVPCELEPLSIATEENFDMVILAYQPWFLSVSIPINSFLQSEEAKILLKNKKVVTLLACRNMWLNAQEKMKKSLSALDAKLVGNITYVDGSANLISLITVLAFVLGGVQQKLLGIFPKYGVSEKVLQTIAPKLGGIILKHIHENNFSNMQTELVNAGAINIKPNLLIMEGRGKVLFPLYANYVTKNGAVNNKGRNTRVRIFGIALPLAILIFSPLITLFSRLAPLIMRNKFKKEIEYYSGNSLR